MIMNTFPRTLLLSLLLHCAAFMFFVNYAATVKERPVIVELTLSRLSGGSEDAAREKSAKKGSRAASGSDRQPLPKTGAAPQPIKPAPANAASAKALERAPQPPPRPVPAAPPVNAQAQPSGEAAPTAGKPAAAGAKSPGSTGGELGKSGRSGGSAQASGGSGSGGGHGNGMGNSPELLRKKYLSENFAYILKIIQDHISYPRQARCEGLTGKALVSFVVLENGQVANIRILRSTDYEILDLNLIETIKRVAPFPKPPIKAELRMQLTYHLEQ